MHVISLDYVEPAKHITAGALDLTGQMDESFMSLLPKSVPNRQKASLAMRRMMIETAVPQKPKYIPVSSGFEPGTH